MSQVLGVVPELNERQTHRATLEEALTNIREAIERFLEPSPTRSARRRLVWRPLSLRLRFKSTLLIELAEG